MLKRIKGLERHHRIPRHEGGSDDDDNLIYLTPTDHCKMHFIRYCLFGNRKDLFAARMMSGMSDKSAAGKLGGAVMRERSKGKPAPHTSKWITDNPEKHRENTKKARGVPKPNLSKQMTGKVGGQYTKSWVITSPDGDVHHISNLAKWCNDNGFNRTSFKNVANGYAKSTNGGWTIALSE